MRNSILCLILLGVFALPAQTSTTSTKDASTDNAARAIRAGLKAVVSLAVFDSNGKQIAQGSGFFVDSQGRVVTNYHVIESASSVIVEAGNGAFYRVAGVLSIDQQNDLAVLKVLGRDFPYIALGDSSEVEAGQRVTAIGSPLGLDASVSDGVISALREIDGRSVIQTSAAISPGSSGGVLLNSRGEVIGVTSFKLTGGENLNFAIPSRFIKPLLIAGKVLAFAPKQEQSAPIATQEQAPPSPPLQVEQPEIPVSIPRNWLRVDDGSPVAVRLEGEYLYEQGESSAFANGYWVDVKCRCDTKRLGSRWIGKCYYTSQLRGYAGDLCNWNADETVTAVSPHRIEGESQEVIPVSDPSQCPHPGSGKERFAYIPAD